MNTLDICNAVRREVEHIADTGFPLDVFPSAVQKIILDAVQYNSLNPELLATAMLSATATAIGNTFCIHVRGDWYTNCSLYFILVGPSGTGKTPALKFAFKPIRDYDTEKFRIFYRQMEDYRRAVADGGKNNASVMKPHVTQTILNDFTPEAMYQRLFYNQRGVVILVDEILALFKSRNRYSSDSKLIEDLLSSFSGDPINGTRKDEENHFVIPIPYINLIGGIQTSLLQNIFSPDFIANGFTDRLLFVAPENLRVPLWDLNDGEVEHATDALDKWCGIIKRIIDIKCNYQEDNTEIIPTRLLKSEEARRLFYAWNNDNVNLINSTANEEDFDTRLMKLNSIVPRFALILQVLRWAAGESHIDFVDEFSMQGALRLNDYYNKTHIRLRNLALASDTRDVNETWFNMLPDEFTTEQALTAWSRVGLKRRSLFMHLKRLCSPTSNVIAKVGVGQYQKVKSQASTS